MISKISLDKSYQVPLDADMELYLVKGASRDLNNKYINTWTRETYKSPFVQSLILDNSLIPCFLNMFLRGISVSNEKFTEAKQSILGDIETLLNKLGLTQRIYASSKKFTEHIQQNPGALEALLNLWPKTEQGYFKKSAKTLSSWLTQHTASPIFKTPEIWFAPKRVA